MKDAVQHPAYPCVEVGGLIFAYMGPPEKQPPFPRYPALFREDGIRMTGKGNRIQKSNALLQTLDNVLDVWHREIAHGWYKPTPPVYGMHHGRDDDPATPIKFEVTPWGACYVTLQNTVDTGVYEYHETHAVFPCQRGRSNMMNWAVPIDDYTTRWFGVSFEPFDKDGRVPPSVYRRMNADTPNDSGGPFYEGWAEDVGYWWNHGHPLRRVRSGRTRLSWGLRAPRSATGCPTGRNGASARPTPDSFLCTSSGASRSNACKTASTRWGSTAALPPSCSSPCPARFLHVGREEGMRLFNMTVAERVSQREEELQQAEPAPSRR